MIQLRCCVCGEEFKDDDTVLRMTVYRFSNEDPEQRFALLSREFEDGAAQKFVHLLCPLINGAPMCLIGADGDRTDV